MDSGLDPQDYSVPGLKKILASQGVNVAGKNSAQLEDAFLQRRQ